MNKSKIEYEEISFQKRNNFSGEPFQYFKALIGTLSFKVVLPAFALENNL
jgi:hypothetical protein